MTKRLQRYVRHQVRGSRRAAAERGNALLFSLLIMGSALVASAGLATLVTGEISTVALIPPAERAYYKAESYIEQGLWEKKQDPQYQIEDKSELPADFLCAATDCFLTTPRNQAGSLVSYESTTSIPDDELALTRDKAVQLDIDTANATGSTGTFDLGSIKNAPGLQGVEVTVTAHPDDEPFSDVTGSAGTPVLVEKKLFRYGDVPLTINLGPPNTNALGEPFPPLNESTYRVRLRALGADTTVTPKAVSNPNQPLFLLTTDFRVSAVAEDGPARRGIEVLVPAASQIASIFDYVIFSDLALGKTDAKAAGKKSVKAVVYYDNNRNCVQDSGDEPAPDVTVDVRPNSSAEPAYSQVTDPQGIASFIEVQPNNYKVSVDLVTGQTACTNNVPISFANDDSTEVRDVDLQIKPAKRVPFYRLYNVGITDHFYTAIRSEYDYWRTHGYNDEGVTGYFYDIQIPGTQPLYRSWNGTATTHFYTMDKGTYDYWNAHGYAPEGIAGYLYPYNGSSCQSGTSPLYESWLPGANQDHLYTMSKAEWDAVTWYVKIGIVGCMWTAGN